MKLSEAMRVTKHHSGPPGSGIDHPRLSDEATEKLILELRTKGIEISLSDSLKDVGYRIPSKSGQVTVPLLTQFPEPVSPSQYILRDVSGKLELELNDFKHSYSNSPKGTIGGTVYGEYGIECKLTYQSDEIDTSIVGKVREALNAAYQTPEQKRFHESLEKAFKKD